LPRSGSYGWRVFGSRRKQESYDRDATANSIRLAEIGDAIDARSPTAVHKANESNGRRSPLRARRG